MLCSWLFLNRTPEPVWIAWVISVSTAGYKGKRKIFHLSSGLTAKTFRKGYCNMRPAAAVWGLNTVMADPHSLPSSTSHPPPPYVVIKASASSTASAGARRFWPTSLGANFWIRLREVSAWGGRTCYCSLSLEGFDSVFYALLSSIAWHTQRHPHTPVGCNAAPTGDLCLSEVAAEAKKECSRASQMTQSVCSAQCL